MLLRQRPVGRATCLGSGIGRNARHNVQIPLRHTTLLEAGQETAEELAARHAASLYDQLETTVLPCFYQSRERFVEIMRNAIAHNGSFFSAQRMVWQYLHNAYRVR